MLDGERGLKSQTWPSVMFCPPEFDVPFHRILVQKKFPEKQKPVAAYANVSEILKNGLRTVID